MMILCSAAKIHSLSDQSVTVLKALKTDIAFKGFFREGVSTSRVYLRPGRESVGDLLIEFITVMPIGPRLCGELPPSFNGPMENSRVFVEAVIRSR